MRITFATIYDGAESVAIPAAQFDRAQRQVETGQRVRLASDDPRAAQRIVRERGELGGIDSYTSASDSATARLAAMDSVLDGVVDKLTEAKATATSARGSTATPATREAAALQLEGVRDALASDLNTSVGGVYLFSGTQSRTQTYTRSGGSWVYGGDSSDVTLAVGRGREVRIGVDGRAIAQGSAARDILSELDALAAAVRAGDGTGVASGIAALDAGFDRAVRAQSQVGADQRGITDQQARLADLRLASETRISRDEDADLAAAITEMNKAAIAYRAALGAVGATARESLMDYLR